MPKKTIARKKKQIKPPKKTIKNKPFKKPIKKKILPKKKLVLKKRPALKKAIKTVKTASSKILRQSDGIIIGKITHFYPQVNAAVIKVKSPLKIGDTIRIKGHTTDLTENVNSMQINRIPISQAKKGDEIGLLVTSRVRNGDIVYRM